MIIDDPQVTTHPTKKDNWILTADFRYKALTLPRGFITDLASIPRVLWWLIAPFELSLTAPIVHDWLYRGGIGGETMSRADVDALFLSIMKDEGVSWWRRSAAYRGVRMFGGWSWRKNRVEVVALEGAV